MRGPHFFKYAALSLHKLPISAQNMRGLHDFIIPAFSFRKSQILYILEESWKMLHLLHTSSHFPVAMGTLWSDGIMRRERHRVEWRPQSRLFSFGVLTPPLPSPPPRCSPWTGPPPPRTTPPPPQSRAGRAPRAAPPWAPPPPSGAHGGAEFSQVPAIFASSRNFIA